MADRHNEDTPLKSEAAIQSGFRPKRLQYALKFIGAALSSTCIVVIASTALAVLTRMKDMIASCISNPFDVYVLSRYLKHILRE